jgi:hypothetical protein
LEGDTKIYIEKTEGLNSYEAEWEQMADPCKHGHENLRFINLFDLNYL